jgi:predicted nucleic acid-binding Zn ribbon protein
LGSYIKSFNTTLLTQERVSEIEAKLREVKATSGLTKSDHLASLKRRHASTDVCPKCGGAVEKLVSSPAIQFKGSGFYLTDYGRGGKSDMAPSNDGKASAGDAYTCLTRDLSFKGIGLFQSRQSARGSQISCKPLVTGF